MQCQEICELIPAYIDGMLSSSLRETVDRHLQNCQECKSELQDLEFVSALIRGLPPVEPLPEFRKNLSKKLEQLDRKKVMSFRSLISGRWPAVAAAVSFLLVMGVASLWSGIMPGVNENSDRFAQGGEEYNIKNNLVGPLPETGTQLEVDATVDKDKQVAASDGDAKLVSKFNSAESDRLAAVPRNNPLSDSHLANPPGGGDFGIMSNEGRGGGSMLFSSSNEEYPRQVILDIEVGEVTTAIREIYNFSERYGGSVRKYQDTVTEIVVMVPDAQLEKVIADLGTIGRIIAKDYLTLEADSALTRGQDFMAAITIRLTERQ